MKKILLFAMVVATLAGCNQSAVKEPQAPTAEKKNVVVENIMNRRSVRSYKPEQISDAQMDTIMKCAINAPSAMNLQPWEVRVVQDASLLNRINNRFYELSKSERKEGASVIHNAPTIIVVAKKKESGSSASDCGMLAQNILLSAESMGIGTCVVGSVYGVFNGEGSKEFMDAIKMPDTHEVMYAIAIGYKNESPQAKPREADKVQYIK